MLPSARKTWFASPGRASVLYWSRSRKNSELDELLSLADVVSLHLPLEPETAGLVDVRKLKAGAILVNTAGRPRE